VRAGARQRTRHRRAGHRRSDGRRDVGVASAGAHGGSGRGGTGRQGGRRASGHPRRRETVDRCGRRADPREAVAIAGFASLTRQCRLFAIGSSVFAVATALGFAAWAGAGTANLLCLVGSWFFTTAAWMQLTLSDRAARFEWSAAAVQFAGTVLFNLSTGAAVWAHAVAAERRYVWVPDATGSLFFLI